MLMAVGKDVKKSDLNQLDNMVRMIHVQFPITVSLYFALWLLVCVCVCSNVVAVVVVIVSHSQWLGSLTPHFLSSHH